MVGREERGEVEAGWNWSLGGAAGGGKGFPLLGSPPTVRGSTGMVKDRRENKGLEGNAASVSPAHLGPRKPAEVLIIRSL